MITLASKLPMPDLVRARLRRPSIDDDINEIAVLCDVIAQGGFVYKTFALVLRDGACTGLRVNAAPTTYDERMQGFVISVPTAFTDGRACFRAAIPNQMQALEAVMIGLGLLPAGVVS